MKITSEDFLEQYTNIAFENGNKTMLVEEALQHSNKAIFSFDFEMAQHGNAGNAFRCKVNQFCFMKHVKSMINEKKSFKFDRVWKSKYPIYEVSAVLQKNSPYTRFFKQFMLDFTKGILMSSLVLSIENCQAEDTVSGSVLYLSTNVLAFS